MARMRIRSIHPELWTDPRFVRCTPQAQVFWIALHNSADDQGVFAWDSFALKMRLLPASTVAAEDLLEELARADLVRRFEAAGEAYGAIRDFGETQRPKDPNAIHPLPEELRAYAGHQVSLEEVLGQLRKRLVEAQGGKCGYCATEVSPYAKKATSCEVVLDVPEERGGVDAPGNKVAACRACARSKGTRTGAEFRAFLCERIGRQAEELRPAPATPRIAVVAGGLSVGIGFGMQQIIANFLSGVLLLFEQTLRPGDVIDINGEMGVVENLSIRATTMRTPSNVKIIVPNQSLLGSSVKTYTKRNRWVRVAIPFFFKETARPEDVREMLLKIALKHDAVRKEPKPSVYFKGANEGASGWNLEFQLSVWIDDPLKMSQVSSELRFSAWDAAGNGGLNSAS